MRELRHTDFEDKLLGHTNEIHLKPNDSKVSLKTISLIIPVYREEKILNETLNKFPQDLLNKYNIELIISDGGSDDGTVEIAKNYTDKIIEYHSNTRQTISAGRNEGAKISEGDILVFINGDSYPENCEEFFNLICDWSEGNGKYKDCIALTCWITVHPNEMMLKDKIFYAIHNRYIIFLNFIKMGMGRGECQIVKKEYFNRVGGYDENLAAGEDFDLFRRLSKIGKIGFIKDIKVFESPRRFRKYGYLKVILQWLINSVSVMIYRKSVSEEWDPVR